MCGCCWAIGVFNLFLLARLRVMSLGRIALVWVDILVCCPVELFGTSPVREVGFGELVLSTAPSSRVLGGGLLQSWQSVEQLAELLVRDFSWTGCLPCGFGAVSEEQWCVVLGFMFRLLVVSLGDR